MKAGNPKCFDGVGFARRAHDRLNLIAAAAAETLNCDAKALLVALRSAREHLIRLLIEPGPAGTGVTAIPFDARARSTPPLNHFSAHRMPDDMKAPQPRESASEMTSEAISDCVLAGHAFRFAVSAVIDERVGVGVRVEPGQHGSKTLLSPNQPRQTMTPRGRSRTEASDDSVPPPGSIAVTKRHRADCSRNPPRPAAPWRAPNACTP